MNNSIKTDDVIFNFFKQICDEKDDVKCVELGNNWINAMETNLANMEANLEGEDRNKHKKDIDIAQLHSAVTEIVSKHIDQNFQLDLNPSGSFIKANPFMFPSSGFLTNSTPFFSNSAQAA